MPDLLGSLIQLLQLLEEAMFGWLANTVLVIFTAMSVIYFSAVVLFSQKVIMLGRLILQGVSSVKPKIKEAMSSPYDHKFANNRVLIIISMLMYYFYLIFVLIYALLFTGIASGFLIDGKLPLSKSLLAYVCALGFFLLARLFKCQGDKELFKLRNPEETNKTLESDS
ncbi:hypothetical protein KDD30_00735 [Photobacterium sp. GJ3]|uniref:hypothetical protein n=1 Tax=Photobacterium sp. GJ3 TaxID=2829502 RepID=UPI001B8D1A07|nr:hypothetical protein [Photobacterium sp. GJ3]QUJ67740.1 hypothetical protein KDD30_00735 [Photobacterium sp. GJ3]